MSSFTTALLTGAALTALAPIAAPALAQSAAAPSNDSPADVITVSARRRDESLQDVPVAVTAISGEELAALGIPDITYVAQTVPNLTLEVSRGTNTTITAFIRGVGQQDPVAGYEPGVGIYIDDVYLNRPQGNVLDVYDVERIEVLRGPQGTLYGRNTIGGAVKYVTKRLGDEPALRLRGTYGTFNQHDLVVSGELPLSDYVKVGAAFGTFNRDGFGTNLFTGEDNYNKEVNSARASIELTPNQDVFIRATVDHLEDRSNPRGGFREIEGIDTGAPVLDDVFDTRGGILGPNDLTATGYSLMAEFNLPGDWSFKSVSAFREDDTISQIDFDALPLIDVDVPTIYENEQFTQEFQFLYEGDAISGVGGLFYIDANAFNTFDVLLDAAGTEIFLPGLNANVFGDVDTESWAIFADANFDLEKLLGFRGFELSLGGRYTEDKRQARVLRQTFIFGRTDALGGSGAVPIATTSDFDGEETFTDFNPRISLAYAPNTDHNIYVSYANGFKGGGFDPRGFSSQAIDLDNDGDVDEGDIFDYFLFEPEEVNSYELGWKARMFNGRWTNNAALFFADYNNVQIPGSQGGTDPGTGAPTFIGITTNAGAAEIYGLELEGNVLVGEDFAAVGDRFSVAYTLGLLEAEYTEFVLNGVDVSDFREVQNTPDVTGSITTNYTVPLGTGSLSFLTVTSYRGDVNQFEVPSEFLDQEAFALFDASLVWTSGDGRLSAGLHGKNLLDEEYRVAGYEFLQRAPDNSLVQPIASTLGLEGVATTFYGPPRQVYATVELRF